MPTENHIVADGRCRALEACQEQIASRVQEAVEADYAERLKAAGFFGRILLGLRRDREIRRQIAAELEKVAPRDALYATRKH